MLIEGQPGPVILSDQVEVLIKVIEVIKTQIYERLSGIHEDVELDILDIIPLRVRKVQHLLSLFVGRPDKSGFLEGRARGMVIVISRGSTQKA